MNYQIEAFGVGEMSTMQKTCTDDNEYIQMNVLIYFDY